MFFESKKFYDGAIISKYPFFNTIPYDSAYFCISQDFLTKNSSKIIEKLPKNFTIYPKCVDNQIDCNFHIAKAAFPECFPSDFHNNLDKIFSKKIDESDLKKLTEKHPTFGKLYESIKKREEIKFEKQSFQSSNLKSFYKLFHPNADRSSERKEEILSQYDKLTSIINEITANNKFYILYLPTIAPENAKSINDFLNGVIDVQNIKKIPKPIDLHFYDRLLTKYITLNIYDDKNKESISISPLLGWFFSDVIVNMPNNILDIKFNNAHETTEMLKQLFSETKVTLKYYQYPILKEIAEKFKSDYLTKCIEKFEENLKDFNNAIKQSNMFIEIQDKIFNITDDNLLETCMFLVNMFQTPFFINEVSHQIEVASKYRPKNHKLYQCLYENIKKQMDGNFKCKITPIAFSNIEQIIVNDDLASLQQYIEEKLKFEINKPIKCNHFNYEDSTLINISCFYGSIKCFKFLLSNEAHIDREKTIKYAIAGGNIEIIHILNENNNTKIQNACHFAAKYHQNEILEWLIEQEIDDSTFLKVASESNNFKAAVMYLHLTFNDMIDKKQYYLQNQYYRHNYFTNPDDEEIVFSVENAVESNHESYFRFLLNFPNLRIRSISSKSIRTLNLDLIEVVMNLENDKDNTHLYNQLLVQSIKSGEKEIIEQIFSWVEKKSSANKYYSQYSFNRYNSSNMEDLVIAALQTKNIEIIEYILSKENIKKGLYSYIYKHNEIAKEIIKTRNEDIIQKFIQYGTIFKDGYSIEKIIEKSISKDDIDLILKMVDKSYFKYRKDWSPFPLAKSKKTISFLIDCDSCINYCDSSGNTCLSNALKSGNIEIVKLLLKNGAIMRPNDGILVKKSEIENILKSLEINNNN